MKTCPTCQRQYADETMKFCLDDGSTLVAELAPTRVGPPDATLYLPADGPKQAPARHTEPSPAAQPTVRFSEALPGPSVGGPSPAVSARPARTGGGMWWVLGALIIAVGGIAVALILTLGNRKNETVASQVNSATSPTPVVDASPSKPIENEAVTRTEQSATNSQPSRPKESTTPAKAPTQKPAVESTPRPMPQETTASRGPISGGVLNGKAVNLVKPAYPAIARSVQASGQVQVQVLIDENGNVVSAHAVSGHPLLQSSAVAAAKASKFRPTLLSGQAVKVTGVIVYNFVAQ